MLVEFYRTNIQHSLVLCRSINHSTTVNEWVIFLTHTLTLTHAHTHTHNPDIWQYADLLELTLPALVNSHSWIFSGVSHYDVITSSAADTKLQIQSNSFSYVNYVMCASENVFFSPCVCPQLGFVPIRTHFISVCDELYNKYVHKYTVSELMNWLCVSYWLILM